MFSETPGHARAQAADAAHVQVDAHARLRGRVQGADAAPVDERVHLHRDPRRVLGGVGGDRPLDLLEDALAQVRGGDQHLAVVQRAPVAGEVVEHVGDVRADLLVGREQAEVGVQPRGRRVVVAGADVHVVAHAVALAAHDQHALGVRLQRRLAVDDVHAGLLQRLRPVDVHALVEARLQLDQRDRLLAALGGVDQRRHQRRVVARAVDGLLDREHVRVGDGLLDEALDRGRERHVRVVHEQVAFAHRAEHVRALALAAQQPRMGDPDDRLLAQLDVAGQLDDLPQRAHVEQAVDRVDLLVLHAQQPRQRLAQLLGAVRADLDAHDLAETPAAQLVLDRLQQVGGVVGDLQVGVACHAEDVVVGDLHAREQRVEMVGDHVLQRHQQRRLGRRLLERDEARQDLGRHLHAREHRLLADRVAHEHGEAEGQVGDVGERAPGRDRQRRQRREDRLLEVPGELRAALVVELARRRPRGCRARPAPGAACPSKQSVSRRLWPSTRSRISAIVSEGMRPSWLGFSTPASIWSRRPATRTM